MQNHSALCEMPLNRGETLAKMHRIASRCTGRTNRPSDATPQTGDRRGHARKETINVKFQVAD